MNSEPCKSDNFLFAPLALAPSLRCTLGRGRGGGLGTQNVAGFHATWVRTTLMDRLVRPPLFAGEEAFQ